MNEFCVAIIPGSGPPHHNVPEANSLIFVGVVAVLFIGYIIYSGYKRRTRSN
jgi:hypothetical protein